MGTDYRMRVPEELHETVRDAVDDSHYATITDFYRDAIRQQLRELGEIDG